MKNVLLVSYVFIATLISSMAFADRPAESDYTYAQELAMNAMPAGELTPEEHDIVSRVLAGFLDVTDYYGEIDETYNTFVLKCVGMEVFTGIFGLGASLCGQVERNAAGKLELKWGESTHDIVGISKMAGGFGLYGNVGATILVVKTPRDNPRGLHFNRSVQVGGGYYVGGSFSSGSSDHIGPRPYMALVSLGATIGFVANLNWLEIR